MAAEKESLYNTLYAVMRREKAETIAALEEIYGLATIDPSIFALDLASRLRLQDACSDLLNSQKQLNDLPPQYVRGPRQELRATISSLNCK